MRPAALFLAVGTIACHGKADVPLSLHGLVGSELATPVEKPGFSFTDTRGQTIESVPCQFSLDYGHGFSPGKISERSQGAPPFPNP